MSINPLLPKKNIRRCHFVELQHASRKSEEDSPRTRIQAIALILAERYQVQQPEFGNRLVLTTFFLLVDLMTFFDEFHARRTENALTVNTNYG